MTSSIGIAENWHCAQIAWAN